MTGKNRSRVILIELFNLNANFCTAAFGFYIRTQSINQLINQYATKKQINKQPNKQTNTYIKEKINKI